MPRLQKPKELFTASEVARFCQVDLKTIHNWSDRGEIRHFRTPGRHLRFRRADVLDFLRKYGYPIPDVLAEGKPRVVVLSTDPESSDAARDALAQRFDVLSCANVLVTLISTGALAPDVVVMDTEIDTADALGVIAALKTTEATRNVRTVLYARATESTKKKALDAGASAAVDKGDLDGLRQTLESLLGLDR